MECGIRVLPSKDSRQKVDLQFTEQVTDIFQHKEKNSSKPISVFDLRKSLAWDSSFFDSPGVLDPEEFRETLNIQLVDKSEGNKQKGSESRESARVSTASNMRKSLAWDNAFFTSAGVLDAEELSIVNRGFKRPDFSQLPKEFWQPSDLNSNLASLEIDLFNDIRSSNHNASSSVAPLTSKLENKNQKPGSRASKKSNALSQVQHGAPIGGSSSSSRKPPRTIPSKRPNQPNKPSKASTGKKMCVRDPCNVSPHSLSPLQSLSRNDHPGLRYASVDLIGRSPSNPRRRIDSQLTASVSSCRTPSKYSIKGRSEVANSSDSIGLFSTPKSLLCKSPNASKTSDSANRVPVRHEIVTTKSVDSQINVSMSLSNPTGVSRKLTPSRLQMPSPKLGYFDADRSIGVTENEGVKFQPGSSIGNVNGAVNTTRNGRKQMRETLAGSRSVLAKKKNEGKQSSGDNEKLGLKEGVNVKERQLGECNKENVIAENNVQCLTRRMGALYFSLDPTRPGA